MFVVVILAIAGTATYMYISTNNEEGIESREQVSLGQKTEQKNYQDDIDRLTKEIQIGLNAGGITPERYRELGEKIDGLNAVGVSDREISSVRSLFSELRVGGREKPSVVPPQKIETHTYTKKEDVVLKPEPQKPVEHFIQEAPKPTCESNIRPAFTHYLIDPNLVTNILPPPNRPKNDLSIIKTHSYINTPTIGVPIYAPIDMELIDGVHYVGGPYYVDFRVSCEVRLRLAHIIDPVEKIKNVLQKEPVVNGPEIQVLPPISFKAGELIGYSGGPPHTLAIGFDFGVYNSATPNRFASQPEVYTSSIYTTAVCPFDYFTPEMQATYKAKYYLQEHGGMQYDLPHFCR